VKDASRKRKILTTIASREFLNSQDREADFLRLLQNTGNDV
jgi:precorrin-2 dehydrogenase / sirohydrochlorin ferrochelatase